MARYEFKLPDIGEGVAEGEIVAWGDGIAVGAVVLADQILAEVMTDKATVTIPSPKSGIIAALGGKVGDVIPVGKTLIVIETEALPTAVVAPPPVPAEPVVNAGPTATAAGSIPEELPGMSSGLERPSAPAESQREKPLAAPATRRLARELGVDLHAVAASGPHGRVTQDDVKRQASGRVSQSQPKAPIAIPQGALEERVPLRGMRKRIFEQMTRSKHTAAHFTFVEECDMTALSAMRSRLAPIAQQSEARLSYLPFIIKACVAALKKHPSLNAAFDEATQEIVFHKRYDIGIAAATDAGLAVPVLKNADAKSLVGLAKEIQRLTDDVRAGRAKREDLFGSTFTITSLGKFGGLFATPILNFPEVAILGVHRIKERPVVRDGQIVIGQVMLLSLSFDHRLIDGHVGAAFAYEVIGYLENPDRLMLEMT